MTVRVAEVPVAGGFVPVHVQGAAGPNAGPALVVVPSIFGPTDDLLATLGTLADRAFIAVADPFWRAGGGALPYSDMPAAFGRLADFDAELCGHEMRAVVDWARHQSNGAVVGLGICFGGPYVNRLATMGELGGVVTWHGSRMEQHPDTLSVPCPVHHHLGSADPVTPPDAIDAIRNALANNPHAKVIVHEGATHGFSHEGDAHDPDAAAAGLASVRSVLGVG